MLIRPASFRDARAIKNLLDQTGEEVEITLLMKQLSLLLSSPDHQLLVAEADGLVSAFCAVLFIQQLDSINELAWISCMIVEKDVQRQGIGKILEQEVCEIARRRQCTLIQAFCGKFSAAAGQFYSNRGYASCPVFFRKQLIDN